MSNSRGGVLLETRSGRRTGAVVVISVYSGWKTRTESSPELCEDATHGWALVGVSPGVGGTVDSDGV